ncbi:glycosyltransferase [Lewinella sp. W8]|uniref:glycosyltransferase n=1 Tax=Lewinella sp. W8 TaxID=2528208 RepID=UPI001067F72E|nr:glycosyltransferase [Lewinella sp. W8]MTB52180.1 glycosyltransferase [Lewinella sp. W8]
MINGIVIPCYNEAKRLRFDAFAEFLNNNAPFQLCFVNDGSTDSTLEELQQFQQLYPERVIVHDMPRNRGKAEAVRAGTLRLVADPKIHNVGFMDADLSTSFEDYATLVDILRSPTGPKKLVFGSRKISEDSKVDRSLFRTIASGVAGTMIRAILRLPVQDTQCGAKVFDADLARSCFRQGFVTRWLFDVELFIRARKQYGRRNIMYRIHEQPLREWVHVEGSKLTLKDSVMIPVQLMKIFLAYDLRPALTLSPQRINRWSYRLRASLNLL